MHLGSRLTSGIFIFFTFFLCGIRSSAAPDFWLTATQTEAPSEVRGYQSYLLRELARQAVVITALHETGHTPADEIFDGYSTGKDGDVPSLRLNAAWQADAVTLDLALDPIRASVAPLRLVFPAAGRPFARPDAFARSLAPELSGSFAAWLKISLPSGRQIAESPALSTDQLRTLETQPDPMSSFTLLRHWHGVASRQFTPDAMAGLARAYILLGESTRHHWSALSSVATARALLYSALLEHRHPDHPLVAETRAWVLTLGGYHSAARVELDKLYTRASPPAWLYLLDAAQRYQTERLADYARAPGPWRRLAAWLTLISVENQRTPNLYERYLEEFAPLLADDPRGIYKANHVLGVGGGHVSTSQGLALAPAWLTRTVVEMPGLPPSLLILARPTAGVSSIRDFALASHALSDSTYPSWGVLGRILWDTQFAFTIDRLRFMAVKWSVNTQPEVAKALADFAGHPHQPALSTLERNDTQSVGASAPFDKLRLGDTVEGMDAYINWAEKHSARFADLTSSQASALLWYRGNDDIHSQRRIFLHANVAARRRAAPEHLALSPAQPAVLVDMIRFLPDWEKTFAAARDTHPGNPLLAAAAADRLLQEARFSESIPLYETARESLGEALLYDNLASAYLKVGDEEGWLRTRLAFYQQPDSGLSHTHNALRIARRYLTTGRLALAIPHAERAARSCAEWAMKNAAFMHLVAGDTTSARAWIDQCVERYGAELDDEIEWHAYAGFGERDLLLARFRAADIAGDQKPRNYELLGALPEAHAAYLATYKKTKDNYFLILAALAALEIGDPAGARDLFSRLPSEYAGNKLKDSTREANHRLATLFIRHLDNKIADDALLAEVDAIIVNHTLDRPPMERYAPDVLYFTARFLRLRDRREASERPLHAAARHITYPDTGRYSLPLLALEFKQRGRDLVVFYRAPYSP